MDTAKQSKEHGVAITKLPLGGDLGFCRRWLTWDEGDKLFKTLHKGIPWAKSNIVLAGREVLTPRCQAWMGDSGVRPKVYSAMRVDWTPEMAQLRDHLCKSLGKHFDYVLLNLYTNGLQYIGYHADDEVRNHDDLIASVSLGAPRRFLVRPIILEQSQKPQKPLEWILRNGDLVTMNGEMQKHYKHSVPKTAKKVGPRINLTFRQS